MAFGSLLFLIICIFSDPGVLPKNIKLSEQDLKTICFLKRKKYYLFEVENLK